MYVCNTQQMADLTDNQFYPSAERIRLRFRFAKWACDRLTEDADFGKKIIFSDEVHFDLGGYVNKQNCSIWGTDNLIDLQKMPILAKKKNHLFR